MSQSRVPVPCTDTRRSQVRRTSHLLSLFAFLLAVRLGEGKILGQTSRPSAVSEAPVKKQTSTDYKVGKLTQALRLADFEGMQPRPEISDQVTRISDFVESAPTDGHAATQKTEAYVGSTATTLYVVFLCFDAHPGLIRGHLARRENILKDDTVTVLLDPFADHRRGVLFQLNPAGVQADAAWTEGSGSDYSYDQVWDSAGQVTPKGWMALFVIPFRSLRFRGSDWGIVLTRSLPRNSETDSWPHISTSVTGTLPQEGTLHGVEGGTGAHNIQLNPYALAQNEHTLLSLDPNNPYFSSRKLEGTAGGDAKVIIKDSIVLDATINPDFSQIESDQPQFTVNQRYSVYFPELRPFFLENANYFATPIDLLYTRNIVHPEFGARLTGKVHSTNLGLLAIDDREPGEVLPRSDPDYGKHALFAVGRVTQDLGKGSNVGLIYTDYDFLSAWNRIGGLDFTARFNDKWTVSGQSVVSSTKAADGTYAAGPGNYLEATRSGHAFNFDNVYKDYSKGFETQVGFVAITDYHYEANHATYQWYPKHGVLQNYGLESNVNVAFDHQGNRVFHYTSVDPFFQFARNTTIAPLLGQNSDTLGPQNGYAIPHNLDFTENFVGFVFRSAPLPQLNFNIVTTYGGNPNYNPAPGAPPSLLNANTVQALVSVQPVRSLTLDNTYLLDRDFEAHGGAFAYESQTVRTKINYQFTRSFSARAIVEYDSVLANPLHTSLVRTKQVSTEALLTWLPHPGTAIYVGYNNDLQNLDRTLCQRMADGSCNPNMPIRSRSSNYLNDGRQIFIKASYLLRF